MYFKNYDEHICLSKPTMRFKNLFFGGMYVDVGGDIMGMNMKTKETVQVQFHEKVSDTQNSYVTGQAYDSQGVKKAELTGSWQSELFYNDLTTNKTSSLWVETALVDNAYMQYMFSTFTVLMNYVSDDMNGYLPPTDSRYRNDLRCYENGEIEQAEIEKVSIELRQRLVRKWVSEGKCEQWQPKYFKEVAHPYVFDNETINTKEDKPIFYEFIEGDKGYFSRREKKDWSDSYNIWGPWEENE